MLEGVVIDDTRLFNDRLQEWQNFCKRQPTRRGSRRTNPLRTAATETTSPV